MFEKELFCQKCDLLFDKVSVFALHMKLVHEEKSQLQEGSAALKNEPEIKREITEVANFKEDIEMKESVNKYVTRNDPIKCKVCNDVFTQKGNLTKHVKAVHEGNKPFKCSFCDYSSSRNDRLHQHTSSIHEGKKPFKCDNVKLDFHSGET